MTGALIRTRLIQPGDEGWVLVHFHPEEKTPEGLPSAGHAFGPFESEEMAALWEHDAESAHVVGDACLVAVVSMVFVRYLAVVSEPMLPPDAAPEQKGLVH